MIFQSVSELDENLKDIIDISDEEISIKNEDKLREFGIDYLIYAGALSDDSQTRHLSRIYIKKLSRQLGIYPSSIAPLYKAFGEGKVHGFTIPAINLRALSYDLARVIFKKILEKEASAVIFEIARSEMAYSYQTQDELASAIYAAAIKEGYEGPIFMQGDHYQFNKKKFDEYQKGQIEEIELACKDAIAAGFYNIDIDASTLVDLDLPEKKDQQANNYEMTAVVTKYIRKYQPSGVEISVGGEIGHIGDRNSDVEDFEAFMEGYLKEMGDEKNIISKVSVATGTYHGGYVMPDGSLKDIDVDFDVLNNIGKVAREKYGLAGTVQHGASTLPVELFDKFPQSNCVEIHLATGLMNTIFESLPEWFRSKMYGYVWDNFQDERKEGLTDEQFMYVKRKKAIGPMKKDMWLLPESDKEVIRKNLSDRIEGWFDKLNLAGTSHTIRQYIDDKS